MINWNLAAQPLNWIIVLLMLAFGIMLFQVISEFNEKRTIITE